MTKKSLVLPIVMIQLCLGLLACGQKTTEVPGAIDNSSQSNPEIATTTTTTVTNTTTTLSGPPPTLPPAAGFDLFKEVAYLVGGQVDRYFSSDRELLVTRGTGSIHETDSCDINLKDRNTFADRISYYVYKNMTPRKAQLGYVADIFNLPSSEQMLATSLISHAMCEVSAETLKQTIGEKRIPNAKVIGQMNTFVRKYNSLRSKMSAGEKSATLEMTKLWSRLSMCLSYVESLTTADRPFSDKNAQSYAPSDYRRPAGVLFYEDPLQPKASALNLGLFQFSPDSGGNMNACLKQWNLLYPSCQVPSGGSTAEMVRVLGSSYQSFNAFCGTEKPSEMFSVQVNSSNSKRTHPANWRSDGGLRLPKDRCVSLFFAGAAYNHFGPFQNSTGNNLEELLTCTLAQ